MCLFNCLSNHSISLSLTSSVGPLLFTMPKLILSGIVVFSNLVYSGEQGSPVDQRIEKLEQTLELVMQELQELKTERDQMAQEAALQKEQTKMLEEQQQAMLEEMEEREAAVASSSNSQREVFVIWGARQLPIQSLLLYVPDYQEIVFLTV